MRPNPVPQWATPGTNYPAGSDFWSGTTVNTVPVTPFFTPNVPVPAQYINSILSGVTKNQIDEQNQVGSLNALNWGLGSASFASFAGVAGTPEPMGMAPVYDPFWGRWIFGLDKGSGATPRYCAFQSYDGQAWSQIGTASLTRAVDCMACLPSGVVCAVEYGFNQSAVLAAGGLTWTESSIIVSGANSPGATAIAAFGNIFVAAYGCQTTGASPVLLHGTDGLTWTIASSALGPHIGSSTGLPCFAAGASKVFFADGSNNGKYYYSTDGISWVNASLPGSLAYVFGATYDSVNNVFYVLMAASTISSGTPGCVLYSSSDLIAWNVVKTFITTSKPLGICADGSLLALVMYKWQNNKHRAMFSNDGGTTWRLSSLSNVTGDNPHIGTNGCQMMYLDEVSVAGSFVVGQPPTAAI